jgi:hypothetical protein
LGTTLKLSVIVAKRSDSTLGPTGLIHSEPPLTKIWGIAQRLNRTEGKPRNWKPTNDRNLE